jgi:hypothetical protein
MATDRIRRIDVNQASERPNVGRRLLARANALDDWAARRGAVPGTVGPRLAVRDVIRECLRPPLVWLILVAAGVAIGLAALGAQEVGVVFLILGGNVIVAARSRVRRASRAASLGSADDRDSTSDKRGIRPRRE